MKRITKILLKTLGSVLIVVLFISGCSYLFPMHKHTSIDYFPSIKRAKQVGAFVCEYQTVDTVCCKGVPIKVDWAMSQLQAYYKNTNSWHILVKKRSVPTFVVKFSDDVDLGQSVFSQSCYFENMKGYGKNTICYFELRAIDFSKDTIVISVIEDKLVSDPLNHEIKSELKQDTIGEFRFIKKKQ